MDKCVLEPGIIKRLDPDVVNRIAAGEIIQRPANALKEMIENSLDAKSSNIQITVKFGGLKLLQIRDNGTGIRKDDLTIVCERFTTSKLKTFEDLQTISTYGFRGEALSSISHVAHLTIQTKTANDKCASKASYEDGRLKGPIKPCAGNQGTQITIEDLFYNVPQRKQFLRSATEEFQRIFDVVSKYSIHNANVSFSLGKYGENIVLRTPLNSTKIANIQIVYGATLAKELMAIEIMDDRLQFEMRALVTGVKYSSKKFSFLLFINHRLVESTALKNAIDQVFCTFLAKGSHPFVYMDLQLEPNNVDVNVHPTKHEVNFLHENEIVEKIRGAIEAKLLNCKATRDVYTQQLIPGASDPQQNTSLASDGDGTQTKIYAKDIIRYDSKEQKLEKFFGQSFTKSTATSKGSPETEDNDPIATQSILMPTRSIAESNRKQTQLTSILTLRNRIENKCHTKLRRMLGESIFVGCVNAHRILIQFESNLYLCNLKKLSEELIYQILLYDFENFGLIELETPLSIKELAVLALKSKASGWCPSDGPIEDLAESVQQILVEKASILREYYGLTISSNGFLKTLPLLLDKHTPFMGRLPLYILRLATEVDWQSEKRCFDTFSRETAQFYAHLPLTMDDKQWKWTVEHIFYDNIKRYLIPSHHFTSELLQIANLSNLYKVFERC